jgi:hypothetical protein
MLEYIDEMSMLKHKFREYSHAFFGAIQLNYSRGLKNLVRISDLTDDEVVELKENEKQEKVEVFTVNKSLFDILYINKLRGEFLAQVERDIKKDGLDSEFKYTNDFIKNAVSDVFGKLETALQKTDQSIYSALEKSKIGLFHVLIFCKTLCGWRTLSRIISVIYSAGSSGVSGSSRPMIKEIIDPHL